MSNAVRLAPAITSDIATETPVINSVIHAMMFVEGKVAVVDSEKDMDPIQSTPACQDRVGKWVTPPKKKLPFNDIH